MDSDSVAMVLIKEPNDHVGSRVGGSGSALSALDMGVGSSESAKVELKRFIRDEQKNR